MEKRGEGEGGRGSEKADVWSLGCVLIQLATCSFMDVSHCNTEVTLCDGMVSSQASDCSVLFQRLHRDPSVLEEVLDKIRQVCLS